MTLRIIAVVGVLIVLGCGSSEETQQVTAEESTRLALAVENSVESAIVPAVSSFVAEVESTLGRADAFCDELTSGSLTSLENQWRTMTETWNRMALYGLGPLNQDLIFPPINFIESMRERGTDYTGTVREAVDDALASDATLDAEFFDGLLFTEVGLLALEVLIFETAEDDRVDADAVLAEYIAQPRKCDYLIGIADDLVRTAREVEQGWRTDYLESGRPFSELLIAGELDDGSEPMPALIVSAFDHLEYIKRRKLEGILDAQLSGNFYPHLVAVLDELERLLSVPEAAGGYGILAHMQSRGFEAEAAQVLEAIDEARSFAGEESRDELTASWGEIEGYLKREIPNGLNVELGLNFSDGD